MQPHSRRTPIVLGIIAGVFVVATLFCCGGLVVFTRFGLNVISVEVQDELANRAEVRENIGEIESFEIDWIRSANHDDDDVFVYDIEGTKGKGRVMVKQSTNGDGAEDIVSAELTMSDGRKIKIDTSAEPESY